MLFEIDMYSDGNSDTMNDFVKFVDDNDDYFHYHNCDCMYHYQHGSVEVDHFNDLLDKLKEFGYMDKCKFSYTNSPNYYSALIVIELY